MPLLEPPLCPQCSTVLGMEPIWSAATVNGFRLLSRPVGLHCPACGIPLKVVQSRIVVALVGTFVAVIALLVGWLASLGPRSISFLDPGVLPYAILVLALGVLYWRSVPGLARVRVLEPVESVEYPLEAAKPPVEVDLPSEEPSDEPAPEESSSGEAKAGEAIAAQAVPDERAKAPAGGADSVPWTCPSCREENPGGFLICWKCQGPHPGYTLAPNPAPAADESDPTDSSDEVAPSEPRS